MMHRFILFSLLSANLLFLSCFSPCTAGDSLTGGRFSQDQLSEEQKIAIQNAVAQKGGSVQFQSHQIIIRFPNGEKTVFSNIWLDTPENLYLPQQTEATLQKMILLREGMLAQFSSVSEPAFLTYKERLRNQGFEIGFELRSPDGQYFFSAETPQCEITAMSEHHGMHITLIRKKETGSL
ncbi:MAG: hypothetical protein PUB69_04005 [Desulfovibrionaceae bacterium]|nr:hypothetical protein [Desulfovibrionaceae bacterium]